MYQAPERAVGMTRRRREPDHADRAAARRAPTIPDEPPSLTRNAVLALLAQLTTGVFTTALTLYLVHALGPEGFGLFALALSFGAIAQLAADFGIPLSVSRFLADNRGDNAAVVSLFADALRLKLAAATVAAGTLFFLASPLATAYEKPELVWPIRAIALSVFAESLLTLYAAAFIGLARVAVNLRLIFVESVAETAASITLVALGAGAAGAAFGRAIGYGVGALFGILIVARLLGRSAITPSLRSRGRTAEIAGYAGPLFIISAGYTLYAQVDVLLIGAFLGTTAVGLFSGALRLSVPLAYVGQALANSVSPRLGGGRGRIAFSAGLRWLVIFQALAVAPVIVWAEPIVETILGPEFSGATNVLRVLALFIFLDGPSRLLSTTVNYLGYAGRRIPIVLAALGINVLLDVILLPTIGVVGAAIGTGTAYTLYVLGHFRICRQVLELPLRPIVLTLVRVATAAAVMSAVLLAVGTSSLSASEWIFGSVFAVIAYGLALIVTGEVAPSEIQRGRTVARVKISRLRGS